MQGVRLTTLFSQWTLVSFC